MKNNIIIEAENNELILKNSHDDYVIIPKKYRIEVQDMIKDGCYGCIDALVETLPVMADYAEDGTIVSELYKQKTGKEWNIRENYSDRVKTNSQYITIKELN